LKANISSDKAKSIILERMMSEECRELDGLLQAPDVLPGQEGNSKLDILFSC